MSLCPCGSKKEYLACCSPIIKGDLKADSPEQLMRSRYSAYAKKCNQYIYDSYAENSKKDQSLNEISSWANQTQWLNLMINHASAFGERHSPNQPLPTVEFTAIYLHENHFFKMHENSRFIFENSHWRYMNGDVTEHIELPTPSRNDLCICQSGKKFKRCCDYK